MANTRETALMVLYEVEKNGAYSNMALKHSLAQSGYSAQDKAFVTNLVYSTVKHKITLDYVLSRYSKIKLKKLSVYILLILRMGICQLMYFDKIPDSAAVNESVRLAKRYGHSASAGFVNGVLRSVIRGRDTLEYPKDKIEYMSVKYSFDKSLVKMWTEDFGAEFTEKLMEASNTEPPMTLRVNTLKTDTDELIERLAADGIDAQRCGRLPYALRCGGFDVASNENYKNGLFTVQDLSAMTASAVLEPFEGCTAVDVCAAPGGKTTHIAQLMNNKGSITAFDIHEHKTEIIKKNAARMGIDIINAVCFDSTRIYEPLEGKADRVLCDVPCSGLGIIRRKPDIKNNPLPDEGLYGVQYKILENAARYLKNGGELVYSTCTINRRENEDIINRFLESHSDFKTVDISGITGKPEGKSGYVTYYPTDGMDGFFICRMKKNL